MRTEQRAGQGRATVSPRHTATHLQELGADFELGHRHALTLRRPLALLDAAEEVADGSRDDALLILGDVHVEAGAHGVCLARTSLQRQRGGNWLGPPGSEHCTPHLPLPPQAPQMLLLSPSDPRHAPSPASLSSHPRTPPAPAPTQPRDNSVSSTRFIHLLPSRISAGTISASPEPSAAGEPNAHDRAQGAGRACTWPYASTVAL